jgi:2-polyprenyl-6-methoxyphenol hydroxylase-like FAD-dependent oxidoreductase
MTKQRPDSPIVIVGGGPVGLWTAIQLKKRCPESHIVVYEKYLSYRRSHVLSIDRNSLSRFAFKDGTLRELEFMQKLTGDKRDGQRTRRTLLRT